MDGVIQADSGLMSLVDMEDSQPCKVQAPVTLDAEQAARIQAALAPLADAVPLQPEVMPPMAA